MPKNLRYRELQKKLKQKQSLPAAPRHLPLHKGGLKVQGLLLFISNVGKYKIGFYLV